MRREPIIAFLIALSVVASGCINSDEGGEQDTNKAPTAQIEAVIPNPAYAGQTITFSASGSDEDGFVVGYLWGSSMDGEISTDQQFSTNTLSVGDHTIYLKVIDDEGKWSSKDDFVLTILPENHAPIGNIGVSEESIHVDEQVNFSAEYISDSDGDELSYNWDFGDGNTSNDIKTQHHYSQPGTYNVFLTVSDGKNFNGNSTFNLVITVEPLLPNGIFVTGPNGTSIEDEPLTMDFVFSNVGEQGAEPSIGVTSSGCIFFIAFEKPMRSCDHGVTWTDTSDGTQAYFTNGPYGWVDPITDRIFNIHMMGLWTTWIAWSDDDGEIWAANPHDSGSVPIHDGVKLGSGPWTDDGYGIGGGVSSNIYETAVYFCFNELLYISCYTSYDGGATFEVGGDIVGLATNNGGFGAITTAPDGTVYLPPRVATPAILFSKDNGLTWEERTMGEDVGTPNPRKNGEVATDTDSNAYNVWVGGDQGVYMSRSIDSGETWEQTSIRISPVEVISATFPHTSAGDPGRIAITYLGSENADALGQPDIDGNPWDGNAHYATSNVTHYLYVTYSLNALDENPIFHTQRVSSDPVQVGSICLNSGDCRSDDGGSNRNLLDFNDLHIDLEGRVYIGFADGCTGTCASGNDTTPANSRDRLGSVYYLGNGPSLYEYIGNLTEFDAARATATPIATYVERQNLVAYSIDDGGVFGIPTLSVIATMTAVAAIGIIALRRRY